MSTLNIHFSCNYDMITLHSSTASIYFRSHELHNSVIFVFATKVILEGQPYAFNC